MTWLDNLEAIYKQRKEELNLLDEMPDERMARVIRELSAYIKASHAVEEACLEFDPVDMGKLSNDRLNAWDNLSPDAKEVIDELSTL